MSVTAAALRELHRIHQQLADLRDRLERGPKQVRAREANVAQLEAKLAEARENAPSKRRWRSIASSSTSKSGEQKVVDLRVKLNAANSNREYQALLEQIAAAEMAGSVLSDEILEGMEKVDQLGLASKEAEKNLAAGKQEMEKATAGRRGFGRLDPRRRHPARSRTCRRPRKRCPPISRPTTSASSAAKAPTAWPPPTTASAPAAASRSRSTCRTSCSSRSSSSANPAAGCSTCRVTDADIA